MKQNWDTLQQSGISTSTGCERAIYTNPQIQLKEGAVIIVMTWAVTTRLIRHHRQTKRATCSFMTEINGQEQSPWQPKTSSHNATVPTISIYWSTDRDPRLSHPVVEILWYRIHTSILVLKQNSSRCHSSPQTATHVWRSVKHLCSCCVM